MKKLVLLCLFMATNIFGQQIDTIIENRVIDGNEPPVVASRSITIKPTTWIKLGSTFHAYISDDLYIPLDLSNNENYVLTKVFQTETETGDVSENKDVIESITYFDGLGRPKQSIAIKQLSKKKDIVTHFDYDNFGRQEKDFLPYPSAGNDGSLKTGAELATLEHYKTNYGTDFPNLATANVNAFSQKNFEDSPLNRVLSQAAPGEGWKQGNGHEIEFAFETNIENEVRSFGVSISESEVLEQGESVKVYSPNLISNGYYAVGSLIKTVTRDENHSGQLNCTPQKNLKIKKVRWY